MTRRVHKLWSMMRISREQAAVALAAGAVACLSSAVVRWSCYYPVQQQVWQQTLFGELADDQPASIRPAPQAEVPEHDHRPDAALHFTTEFPLPAVNQPLLPATRADAPAADQHTALRSEVTPVQFTERSGINARQVQTLGGETPSRGDAVWLSGGIEDAAESRDSFHMAPGRKPGPLIQAGQ